MSEIRQLLEKIYDITVNLSLKELEVVKRFLDDEMKRLNIPESEGETEAIKSRRIIPQSEYPQESVQAEYTVEKKDTLRMERMDDLKTENKIMSKEEFVRLILGDEETFP